MLYMHVFSCLGFSQVDARVVTLKRENSASASVCTRVLRRSIHRRLEVTYRTQVLSYGIVMYIKYIHMCLECI